MFHFILLFVLSAVWAKSSPHLGVIPRNHGHIVGGSDATIEQFPHQIALFHNESKHCGGSIFSKNAVITAAHCIESYDVQNYKVYAGTTRLSKPELQFSVVKIYEHENYNPATSDCDIAIFIIGEEFEFNDRVQPIALAESRPPVGSEVITIGWGDIESGGISSDHLQQVYVNVVDNETCERQYEKEVNKDITENMICAGVEEGGKDSCQGDSGGPLIVDKKLLGVVSFGHGCGMKEYPGVYASIPELHDWVLETLQEHNAALQ